MPNRRKGLIAAVADESRRYMAAYVLFNQAIADRLGMHPTDVQCFSLLAAEPGPVSAKRVGELSGLTTGATSRLLDRLERASLISRTPDPADRRRVLVAVVPEAVERVSAVWDEFEPAWQGLFTDLSEEELSVLVEHMRRVTEFSRQQIELLRGG
ncbi:MarR family winged helix-turn-helix transcriptional regulator [Promicromonospora sp. NPDC057138]|uniref:MarR family winged helix-turn-helix transcriptional regulator n=1 Tax=Promicromonospora sp. NPDC057138 TaxID=3346031 RepID=UPI00363A12A7